MSAVGRANSHQLPEPFTLGVIKGLLLRHIRWFTRRSDVFTREGALSVGWAYPNGYISEVRSESDGAALSPRNTPRHRDPTGPSSRSSFWPFPPITHSGQYQRSLTRRAVSTRPASFQHGDKSLRTPRATHTCSIPDSKPLDHAYRARGALTSRMSFKPQRNDAAKYSKLAYSASFGFSLPTDPTTLRGMGPDSSVLVSLDGSTWKARRECKAKVRRTGVVESIWMPYGQSISSLSTR